MSNVKQTLPSNNPLSAWTSKVSDMVQKNQNIRSFDFLTNSTVGGTHLTLHPKYKYTPNAMKYVGDWNPSGSYNVGDVVSVYDAITPATSAIETDLNRFFNGTLTANASAYLGYPAGVVWQGTYTQPVSGIPLTFPMLKYLPIPGQYVCITTVPPLDFYPQMVIAGILPPNMITSTNQSQAKRQILQYCRFADVNYFPSWPPLTRDAVVDPNNLSLVKGNYWRILSLGAYPSQVCSEGVNYTQFTDTQATPTSGSWINTFPTPVTPS